MKTDNLSKMIKHLSVNMIVFTLLLSNLAIGIVAIEDRSQSSEYSTTNETVELVEVELVDEEVEENLEDTIIEEDTIYDSDLIEEESVDISSISNIVTNKTVALETSEEIVAFADISEYVTTFAELSNAIANAPTDGSILTINVLNDIDFDTTTIGVSDINERNIIIQSDNPSIQRSFTRTGVGRHFYIVNQIFTFNNIIIDGVTNDVPATLDGRSIKGSGGIEITNSTIVFNNTIFRNNTAGQLDAGMEYSHGGALYIINNSTVTINDSLFYNNAVYRSGAAIFSGNPIGYYGNITELNNTVKINNSIFRDNANGTNGTVIEVSGSILLEVNDSQIINNTGGISSYLTTEVNITDTLISNNYAYGLYFTAINQGSIRNSEITLNSATTYQSSSGVSIRSSNITFDSTIIHNNGNANTISGGGITIAGHYSTDDYFLKRSTVNFINTQIYNNQAITGGGINATAATLTFDDLSNISTNNATNGGGISITVDPSNTLGDRLVTLNNPTIYNNTASNNGGGIFIANGGTYTADNQDYIVVGLNTGNITNGSISNNRASNGGGIYVSGYIVNMGTAGPAVTYYTQIKHGRLVTNGTTISNNIASNNGGGVFVGPYLNTSIDLVSSLTNTHVLNNTASNGGGVFVDGATLSSNDYGTYIGVTVLEIDAGNINNNTASVNGGGIVTNGNGKLTLRNNVEVKSNTATTNGGGIYLYNNASLTIYYATIDGNRGIAGAGIYALTTGVLTMSDGKIINNVATGTNATALGAGIYFNGNFEAGNNSGRASVRLDNSDGLGPAGKLIITGGLIDRNTTPGNGGAVYLLNGIGDLSGATLSNNQARYAGGIYASNFNGLRLRGGLKIDANRASAYAGGIWSSGQSHYTMDGIEVTRNVVTGNNGGGIYINTRSTFDMNNTLVQGNRNETTGGYWGGGLTIVRNFRGPEVTYVTITNSIIDSNYSNNSAGGMVVMYVDVHIENTQITNNSARTEGGGIYFAYSPVDYDSARGSNHRIINSTISGNTAQFGAGIYANVGGTRYSTNQLTIEGSTITRNIATGNVGGIGVTTRMNLEVVDSEISYNQANNYGGVFLSGDRYTDYLTNEGTINNAIFRNAKIINNSVNASAAGIYSVRPVTFYDSRIANNVAPQNGGGLYLSSANAVGILNNSIIEGNTAIQGAGMLVRNSATLTLNNSSVNNNIASSIGGAAYIYNGASVTFNGSEVKGNQATNGGGIYIEPTNAPTMSQSSLTLNNVVVDGNRASEYGGAIYHGDAIVLVKNETSFTNNYAGLNGGAINSIGFDWSYLNIDNTVVFNRNIAGNGAFKPLESFSISYPNIKWATISLPSLNHAINNYDINWVNEEDEKYMLEVSFVIQVEGQEPITITVPVLPGTILSDTDLIPNIMEQIQGILSQPIFTGYTFDQIFQPISDWLSNNSNTLDDFLDRDTTFTNTIDLRRFTVTFVDPQLNLFGDTILIPWGSNLTEPAVRHPQYMVQAGQDYGWYLNIITTRSNAVDAVTNATTRMPGNHNNPEVHARKIIVTMPGVSVPNVPFTERLESLSNNLSNNVVQLDTSNAVPFIFTGNVVEDVNASHDKSATLITSDKVLTRLVSPLEDDNEEDDEDVLGATRQPGLSNTGSSYIVFVVALLLLTIVLSIGKKFKL